jgi:hypothetical protein
MVFPLDILFTKRRTKALLRDPSQSWATESEIDLSRATDSLFLPQGTEEQRRFGAQPGQIRFNTTTGSVEITVDGLWVTVASDVPRNGSIRYNEATGVLEGYAEGWTPLTRQFTALTQSGGAAVWDAYYEIGYLEVDGDVAIPAPTGMKTGQQFTLITKAVGAGVPTFDTNIFVIKRNEYSTTAGDLSVYRFDCVGAVLVGGSI